VSVALVVLFDLVVVAWFAIPFSLIFVLALQRQIGLPTALVLTALVAAIEVYGVWVSSTSSSSTAVLGLVVAPFYGAIAVFAGWAVVAVTRAVARRRSAAAAQPIRP
jgi:hypothetical protein